VKALRLGAVLTIVIGALLLVASPSSGDSILASVVQVGWWSQQPGAQAQPDGGFQVTLLPSGPQSVAAVELSVGDGKDVTTTLTLTEGQSVRSDSAALQACAIRGSWKAENPGAWANVPAYDCSTAVNFTRDAASTTWTGNVSPLVTAGGLSDIIILPVAQPVGGVADPGFQVTITKASATADGTPPADTFSTVEPSASSDFSSGSSNSSFATPSSGTQTFTPPPAGQITAAATPAPVNQTPTAPAPANLSPPPAAATAQPFGKPALTTVGGPNRHKPWGRLLFLVPLAVLVGAGAAFARRQVFSTAIQ
jgi:hypothetical protein